MRHVARKRFGQHFLADESVIDAIVREIAPRAGQPMVEIGPGLAALTQPLVERLGRLTVIELDREPEAREALQKILDAPLDPAWAPEDREFKDKAAAMLKMMR